MVQTEVFCHFFSQEFEKTVPKLIARQEDMHSHNGLFVVLRVRSRGQRMCPYILRLPVRRAHLWNAGRCRSSEAERKAE
jgi:hypothetical protein